MYACMFVGLYLRAMAHGIDLVLDAYRKLLVIVEKQVSNLKIVLVHK